MSWHVSSSGKCTTHKPNESRARAAFWLRIYRFLLFFQSKTTASINTYTKSCIHSTSSMEWVWETENTNAHSRSRMSDVPHLKHLKIRHLFSLLLLESVCLDSTQLFFQWKLNQVRFLRDNAFWVSDKSPISPMPLRDSLFAMRELWPVTMWRNTTHFTHNPMDTEWNKPVGWINCNSLMASHNFFGFIMRI